MNKLFSFLAGAMCGALVGGVSAILLAPASGDELRTQAVQHLENAIQAGRHAEAETKMRMQAQFVHLKEK